MPSLRERLEFGGATPETLREVLAVLAAAEAWAHWRRKREQIATDGNYKLPEWYEADEQFSLAAQALLGLFPPPDARENE